MLIGCVTLRPPTKKKKKKYLQAAALLGRTSLREFRCPVSGVPAALENRTETTEEHPGTLHLSGKMREILRRIRTGTANMINFMHMKTTFASCKVQLHYLPS